MVRVGGDDHLIETHAQVPALRIGGTQPDAVRPPRDADHRGAQMQLRAARLQPPGECMGVGVHAPLHHVAVRAAAADDAVHPPERDDAADHVPLGIRVRHRKAALGAGREKQAAERGGVAPGIEVPARGPVAEAGIFEHFQAAAVEADDFLPKGLGVRRRHEESGLPIAGVPDRAAVQGHERGVLADRVVRKAQFLDDGVERDEGVAVEVADAGVDPRQFTAGQRHRDAEAMAAELRLGFEQADLQPALHRGKGRAQAGGAAADDRDAGHVGLPLARRVRGASIRATAADEHRRKRASQGRSD